MYNYFSENFLFPKGTNLLFFPQGTNKNSDVFKDPEKFDPDRFLPHNFKPENNYSYVPFSAGPRKCIGKNLQLYLNLKICLNIFKLRNMTKIRDVLVLRNMFNLEVSLIYAIY